MLVSRARRAEHPDGDRARSGGTSAARTAAIVALLAAAIAWALPAEASAAEPSVWLCRPGQTPNPCAVGLDTTRLSPSGQVLGIDRIVADRDPAVDCFYVYPTVSDDPGPSSDLIPNAEERAIALYQAARFSQHCRVFAPVYRQLTIGSLFSGATPSQAQRELAYGDVLDAWREYLNRYSGGRGVVLIGHSQGSYVLRELIAEEVDRDPTLRKRLVSAILLGGNVMVREGRTFGGDFQHVKGCKSPSDIGCAVAFSTFDEPVPPGARFGRVGDPLFANADPARYDILCTNPASLSGGAGRLDPVLPAEPFPLTTTIGLGTAIIGQVRPAQPISTPWYSAPGAYEARCDSSDDADVLQISPRGGAPDLLALPEPGWGLHLVDGNIALGNLVNLVRSQIGSYSKRGRPFGVG